MLSSVSRNASGERNYAMGDELSDEAQEGRAADLAEGLGYGLLSEWLEVSC